MPETEPRLSSSTAVSGLCSRKAETSLGPSSSPKVSEPRIDSESPATAASAAIIHMPETNHFMRVLIGFFS